MTTAGRIADRFVALGHRVQAAFANGGVVGVPFEVAGDDAVAFSVRTDAGDRIVEVDTSSGTLTITTDADIGLLVTTASGARVLQVNPGLNSIWIDSGAELRGNASDHSDTTWSIDATDAHLRRGGGAPSATAETAAGTGATVSVAGADDCFRLVLTTGSSGLAAGKIITVTFAHARDTTEYAIALSPADSDSAVAGAWAEYSTRTTAAFAVHVPAALPANRSHIWTVQIGESL